MAKSDIEEGELMTDDVTVHSGLVAKALACNARGDRFASHLRRYLFLKQIYSAAQRVVKWLT